MPHWFRRSIAASSAILIYSAFAFFFFIYHRGHGEMFQVSPDSLATLWFLNWWPFAISHHINPIINHYVWEPVGFNMLWTTSVPTLAILAWPLTHLFGVVTAWNVLQISSPILAAASYYWMLRTFKFSAPASIAGGYFFGFSSYMIGQMLGHLNLVFVALIPIMVLLSVLRAKGAISRVAFVLSLALVGVLQFGISTEILVTSALFWWASFLLFYKNYHATHDLKGLAVDAMTAALVAAIILSPALYFLAEGAGQVPKVINSPYIFSADLLNFFFPTPVTRVGHNVFSNIASHFTGNYSEEGAYFGIPLMIVIMRAYRDAKYTRWAKPLFWFLLIAAVCAMGPSLHLNGHTTKLRLPWDLFVHLPVFQKVLPTRLALYAFMGAGIFVASYLDSASNNKPRALGRFLVVFLAAYVIFPNSTIYSWTSPPKSPPGLNSSSVEKLFGPKPNLIVLPYGTSGHSMLWQLRSGMSFSMSGGYLGDIIPKYFQRFHALAYLYGWGKDNPSKPEFKKAIFRFCLTNRLDAIAITPRTRRPLVNELGWLDWRETRVGDVTYLRVPKELKYASGSISASG